MLRAERVLFWADEGEVNMNLFTIIMIILLAVMTILIAIALLSNVIIVTKNMTITFLFILHLYHYFECFAYAYRCCIGELFAACLEVIGSLSLVMLGKPRDGGAFSVTSAASTHNSLKQSRPYILTFKSKTPQTPNRSISKKP